MKNFNPLIDINKIFVVDDVAPDWLHASWVHRIETAQRWKYGLAATRLDAQRFFAIWISQAGAHRGTRGPFTGDHEGIANYFNDLWQDHHLPKIMPDARVINIHRVHVNGQFPSNEELGMHYDWDDLDMWTMVYYLDGTGGDTLFFENPEPNESGELSKPKELHRISFKPNRAIFFPSFYWHSAENPPAGLRTSLAFNYLLNRCNVNEELRTDRGIIDTPIPPPDLTEFYAGLDEKAKYERFLKNNQTEAKSLKKV
jgi:hypothetical protein